MRRAPLLCACVLFCAAAGGGAPEERDRGFFSRMWEALLARARERAPVPVEVTWRKRKAASLDLGAPLLAMDARDLTGDGRTELVALTTRELLLLGPGPAGGLEIAARADLPEAPPAIRPRDPVGALSFAGREVRARTSEQGEGAAYAWEDGALEELRRVQGFPLCGRGEVELERGRNYFAGSTASWAREPAWSLPDGFYAAICRDDLVDLAGRPMEVFGVVDIDRILSVRCAAGGRTCAPGPARERSYGPVGFSFEIADVNRDGSPEVLTSQGQAPGDPDRVTVYGLEDGEVKAVVTERFQGGVVGLCAGDLDADGALEVVAAVRLVGSTRIDVWTLNE